MARIAASPRLTMASRWNGRAIGAHAGCSFPDLRASEVAPTARFPPVGPIHTRRSAGAPVCGRAPQGMMASGAARGPHAERAEPARSPHQLSHRRAAARRCCCCTASRTRRETWEHVAPRLAERFTVIAPDLLGHGQVGDAARRLLARRARQRGARRPRPRSGSSGRPWSGIRSAAGSRCSSPTSSPSAASGWCWSPAAASGREVHVLLRAASLPGADYVLPALTSAGPARRRAAASAGCCGASRLAPSEDVEVLARGFASLDNAGSRQAFLHTVRAVIEPGGQRVSAQDRLDARRAAADADRVGRARLDHPGRARRRRRTRRCPAAASRSSRTPATCRTTPTPSASPRCSREFCDETDAARLAADHWRPLMDGDGP